MQAGTPFGWLGDYKGFRVVETHVVVPSTKPACREVVLSPIDTLRQRFYWNAAFCAVVPGQLDYLRLVQAATELVTACPVVAGRCDLSPPASIRLDTETLGVRISKADWPGASVAGFESTDTHCFLKPALEGSDEGCVAAPPYEDVIEARLPGPSCRSSLKANLI